MFELSQLRCFVAVAVELNFRRAAEQLNMTQPPLSRQIQLLEQDLGVRLFERTTRSVRLTESGRLFLLQAQDILQRAETAALRARQAGTGKRGSLALGFVPVAAFRLLPALWTAAQARVPEVALRLHEMSTVEQVEALSAGRIELGILKRPRDPVRLECRCIMREAFVLALPIGHHLVHKPSLSLGDLDGEAFIMYAPEGPYTYELLAPLLTQAGVRPHFVQHVTQTHTMLSLVNAGFGAALVPASAMQFVFPSLVFREVTLPQPVWSETFLAWRVGNDSPVMASLRSAILDASVEPSAAD